MTWTEIYPSAHFGKVFSLVFVWGTSLGLLVMAVLAFIRARRRSKLAAAAAAMLAPDHALRAGGLREGEALLSGVVVHADDHDVAVRIDVLQRGTEHESSGSYSYRWTEYHREVTVRPFYLELADKTRVRVLAPKNVEVADALDQKVLLSDTKRKLSAELIPGETLHAQGWLERGAMLKPGGETGYRDADYEWQLVPTKGRMLLSSEPLGTGMEKRAAFHRGYGRWAVFAFLICQLMFLNYHSRMWATSSSATIIKKDAVVGEDSEGHAVTTYELLVSPPLLDREVSESEFERVDLGDTIAVRQGVFNAEIGDGASIHIVIGLLALALALTFPILYLFRRRSTRPWFRRKVVHSGPGHLPGKLPD